MVNVIIEVSKYLMTLFIAIYTYLNFSYFRFHDEERQRRICVQQNLIMALLHLTAYSILYLKSEDERFILFYLEQVVFFAAYIGLYRLFYRNRTQILVNNMCMLMCVGWIIMARLSFDKALRQFFIVAAAALATWIIPLIVNRIWQLSQIPWIYGLMGLGMLAMVWMIGNNSYGAQLSLTVGGLSLIHI